MREALGYLFLLAAAGSFMTFFVASMKLTNLPLQKTSKEKPERQLVNLFFPTALSSSKANTYFVSCFWWGLLAAVFGFTGAYLLRWQFTLNGIEFGGGQ